jgi:hypothetical protein
VSIALAGLVICAIALPHLLSLKRVNPTIAIALWGSALALRALTGVFLTLWMVFFVPHTALFDAVTHWCWHAVMPLVATHMGLDGHRIGDAATIMPSFLLVASVLSVALGVARAAHAVRRLVTRDALGTGPDDSVIVGGPEVMVAAAGLTRPRVIVTAGALTELDDEELAAGLEHERGHIARQHRFVFMFAELSRAVGRFVPGTRHALNELTFHLERDADQWALDRRHDPYALASAICKAATPQLASSSALATLGGAGVAERLGQLLDGSARSSRALTSTVLRVTAAAAVTLTLALAALVPPTAIAGLDRFGQSSEIQHCRN